MINKIDVVIRAINIQLDREYTGCQGLSQHEVQAHTNNRDKVALIKAIRAASTVIDVAPVPYVNPITNTQDTYLCLAAAELDAIAGSYERSMGLKEAKDWADLIWDVDEEVRQLRPQHSRSLVAGR
jgi:hypothetical protein